MNNPLVSIIIPVYNAENFIVQTIRSVQDQSVKDIEIIAINDGSKDKSLDKLYAIQSEDPRVKVIDKRNSGVCDTRNTGIKEAKGDFLAFLDADDLWEPDNLELKLEAMRSSGAKWAHSNLYFVDENGKELPTTWERPPVSNFSEEIFYCDKLLICGPSSDILVHRSIMDEAMFDPRIASPADRDFCIQLSRKGEPVFVNRKLWRYRIHTNSMSATNTRIADDMAFMYEKYVKEGYFKTGVHKNRTLSKLYLMLFKIYVKNDRKYFKGGISFLKYLYYQISYLISKLFTKK